MITLLRKVCLRHSCRSLSGRWSRFVGRWHHEKTELRSDSTLVVAAVGLVCGGLSLWMCATFQPPPKFDLDFRFFDGFLNGILGSFVGALTFVSVRYVVATLTRRSPPLLFLMMGWILALYATCTGMYQSDFGKSGLYQAFGAMTAFVTAPLGALSAGIVASIFGVVASTFRKKNIDDTRNSVAELTFPGTTRFFPMKRKGLSAAIGLLIGTVSGFVEYLSLPMSPSLGHRFDMDIIIDGAVWIAMNAGSAMLCSFALGVVLLRARPLRQTILVVASMWIGVPIADIILHLTLGFYPSLIGVVYLIGQALFLLPFFGPMFCVIGALITLRFWRY